MRKAHFTGREALPVKDTTFPSLLEEVGAEGHLWGLLCWCHPRKCPCHILLGHSCIGHLEVELPGTAHPPLLDESEQNNSWVRRFHLRAQPAWGLFPQLLPSSHCSFLWAQTWFLLSIIGCSNPMLKPHLTPPLKFSPDEGTGVIFSKDQKNAKRPTAADLISFNMFNYKPDDSEGTHSARAVRCKLFKILKKGNFLKLLLHMCSIIIIPCELTSQNLLGKKRYTGFLTLLWFSCSFYQMKQESDLLRKSVTALVLIPPPLISRAAQIKDRPFSCVWCGAWLWAGAAQSPLSARAVLSSQPSLQGQCQAALCCWKNVPCQSPEKWNSS